MSARHKFDYEYRRNSLRSLGFKDDRGRDVGALVVVMTETVVVDGSEPDVERDRWRSHAADSLPLGDAVVYVKVQPARDGKKFGSSQSEKLIGHAGPETDKKVKAEIERRIASMTKRYHKQFAKGA